MLSSSDLEKLKTAGMHQIKVKYLNAEQTLNINIRADETEFRVEDNFIQWKYKSETTWKNLISLELLKGETGSIPTIEISNDGFWVINGVKTDVKAKPEDSENVKITYVLNGGELLDGNEVVQVISGSYLPLPEATKENYLFQGWYDENGYLFNKYDTVSQDLILYAKWKVKPTELEAFFDKFNSNNVTVSVYYQNKWETVALTAKRAEEDGLITEYYDIENDRSYYIAYDDTFVYYFEDIIGDLAFEFHKIDSFGIDYEYKINTEILNSLHFHNEEERKFSAYVEEDEIAEFLQTDYYKNQACNGDVIVDLENQSIVLEFDIYDGEYYWQETYEFQVSNFGTTESVLPYWKLFENLTDLIEIERGLLTDDSITLFDNFVNQMNEDYQKVENLQEFALFIRKYLYTDPGFEYDPIKEYRYETILDLTEILEINVLNATDDSILEMEALFDEAVGLINSGNHLEILAYFLDYKEKIEIAREIDPIKETLFFEKQSIIFELTDTLDYYLYYIRYFSSKNLLERYNYYLEKVNKATSLEEMETFNEEFHAEISQMDFEYNYNFQLLKDEYVDELYRIFDYLDYYLTEEYSDNLIQAIKEVYDLDHIVSALNTSIISDFSEFLLAKVKDHSLFVATMEYEYYHNRIMDTDLEFLESIYQVFLDNLEEAVDIVEVYELVDDLGMEFVSLEIDPFKRSKLSFLSDLDFEYTLYLEFATNESTLLMESIMALAISEIELATTTEDLEQIFNTALEDLLNAYDEDEVKFAVFQYLQKVWSDLDFVYDSLCDLTRYYDEIDLMEDLFYQYYPLFNERTSILEIDNLLEELLEELVEIPFVIRQDVFIFWKVDLIDDLKDQLEYSSLEPTSEDYLTCLDLIDEISSKNYLMDIFALYFDFSEYLYI
jgi:uncharacterized repeat protein (TIGR02543 family)